MYVQTCCYLMMYFNLMKFFYFPIFHVHKNLNFNHFNSISKGAIFRVLHLCGIWVHHLLTGSAEPSCGTALLLNPPPGRCPSRSIGSGGPLASPRWRFCGHGSRLGSNEKVEMTLSASEQIGRGLLCLIYIFSPGSV